MDPPLTFGDWLLQRRNTLVLTREQLAQRVGCSVSTLRKIEAGERRPSLQIAELLANTLDLPPAARPTFLKVARGQLNFERLPPSAPPFNQPGQAPPPTRPKANRLPVNPTPLIGRQRELADLGQLLADPACQLLTLTGPGGIGKTRLAIRAARQGADSFADGIAFVPLAPLTSASYIIPAVAEALDFSFSGPADVQTQLMHFLRDKQLLLVLDSAEHLLAEGMAELLAELRTQAPAVTLLVTSREVLDLRAEWVFEVHGLPVSERRPNGAEGKDDGVELFLQRARRAHVQFTRGTEDDAAIARICQLVDGMPLALELAASWVRTLSCAEIAAELEHGLDFLATSARDRPARHRSMVAVCDYSWRLLPDEERRVMRRLSVFRGGFRREAAEQVATATLAPLSALVSKSWLRHTDGERYEIHELLLQYAAARLAEDPDERAEACRKHTRYYLAWLGSQELSLKGADQMAAAARVTADFKNVRAAWEWAAANRSVVDLLAGSRSLFWFMEMRSRLQEATACFQRAVDALDLPSEALEAAPREWRIALAQSLEQLGYYRLRIGLAGSQSLLERSLALLRPVDPSDVRADAQRDYGVTLYMTGDFENGIKSLRAVLRTYQDQMITGP
jgi:predicted ATPase/transcriptional regulator with XRE-family HTH domain